MDEPARVRGVERRADLADDAKRPAKRQRPLLGELLERGIRVSAEPLAFISTDLEQAKLEALQAATAEARRRAEIIVKGLGGKLGHMRASSLGVYQITPRFSTNVTDYGVNDTSSRDKDVNAVVSVTFDVKD